MNDKTGLACFGLAAFAVVSIVANVIIDGWVLSTLWGWFISPLFGLPSLSIPTAIGIALFVGLITKKVETTSDEELSNSIKSIIARVLFYPLTVLLIGWIVKLFI